MDPVHEEWLPYLLFHHCIGREETPVPPTERSVLNIGQMPRGILSGIHSSRIFLNPTLCDRWSAHRSTNMLKTISTPVIKQQRCPSWTERLNATGVGFPGQSWSTFQPKLRGKCLE